MGKTKEQYKSKFVQPPRKLAESEPKGRCKGYGSTGAVLNKRKGC